MNQDYLTGGPTVMDGGSVLTTKSGQARQVSTCLRDRSAVRVESYSVPVGLEVDPVSVDVVAVQVGFSERPAASAARTAWVGALSGEICGLTIDARGRISSENGAGASATGHSSWLPGVSGDHGASAPPDTPGRFTLDPRAPRSRWTGSLRAADRRGRSRPENRPERPSYCPDHPASRRSGRSTAD